MTNDVRNVKVCSTCQLGKEPAAFAKDKHRVDGLKNVCRSCAADYAAAYREKHREELNAYQRQWRRDNPTYQREWREYGPRRTK
ncbi:hypothetical protein ACIA2T_19800 [Amycolatopsis japonica]|uniref:hypothetical protein n=1 Tax=Amycolatopsis japonica TaxID=208439 RepID=UPI00379A2E95